MKFSSILPAFLALSGLASLASAGNTCNPPASFCDAGCYTLGNKVTGAVAPPNYGLRLDGLFGAPNDHYTFDFEAPNTGVTMCYDGAGTVTVQGTAFGGHDIGGAWDMNDVSFIDIHFTWVNAACVNGDLLVQESNGGYAYGTVTWLATGEVFYLTGKANNAGDILLFDGANGQEARSWVMWGNGHVGDFSMVVQPNSDCPPPADCDGDLVPDMLEADCDANGIPDDCEPGEDCDQNGIPDRCDILLPINDLDGNGVLDACEPGIWVFCTGDGQAGGTSVDCPCGNNVAPGAPEGCINSTGNGAALSTLGSPSVAAADLVLTVSGASGSQPGFFFAGSEMQAGGSGTPFLNGLRCIGGQVTPIRKIPSMVQGATSFPFPGSPPLVQLLGVNPGDTTYFQYWYRDPQGPCGTSANTTNGLRVTWGL